MPRTPKKPAPAPTIIIRRIALRQTSPQGLSTWNVHVGCPLMFERWRCSRVSGREDERGAPFVEVLFKLCALGPVLPRLARLGLDPPATTMPGQNGRRRDESARGQRRAYRPLLEAISAHYPEFRRGLEPEGKGQATSVCAPWRQPMLGAEGDQARRTFSEDATDDKPFDPPFAGASSSSSKAEFLVSFSSKDVSISAIVTSISWFALAFFVFFPPCLAASEQSTRTYPDITGAG